MEFAYLRDALNEMSDLLALSEFDSEQGNLIQVAIIGCQALTHLSQDVELYSDLEMLATRRRENLHEFKIITSNIKHFTQDFLRYEETVLRYAGVSPIAAKLLRLKARKLQEQVINPESSLQDIRAGVDRLRDVACNIAQTLQQVRLSKRDRQKHKKHLWAVTTGIGGIVLIGVNASTTALTPAGSAISGKLGEALLVSAVALVVAAEKNGNMRKGHS